MYTLFSKNIYQVDLDKIVPIATMAHKFIPHSSAGESPLYLMFGSDPFMPTLFKLLLSKLRHMGNEKCRIHLDVMCEIYMMAVLNLRMALDKSPPIIKDPSKANFKRGNMVLLGNHTPKETFCPKYKLRFQICKKISDKAFEVQDNLGKVK